MYVLLYKANLINYVRFILLIATFYNIKRSPVLTFIFGILAGLIDDFDGKIAREYGETSTFGAAIDRAMDRGTTTYMYFFLASVYPKLWCFFASVGFVELIGDILRNYRDTILLEKGLSLSTQNLNNEITYFNLFLSYFLPFIWYSSDLFYWFLYFGSFLTSKTNELTDQFNQNNKTFNQFFKQNYLNIFDKISIKLEAFLAKYDFKMLKLKLIFRIISLILIFGAIGKYYINLESCIFALNDLIQLDIKLSKPVL